MFDKIFYTLNTINIPIPVTQNITFNISIFTIFMSVSIISILLFIIFKFIGYETDLIFKSAGNRAFNNMGFGMNTLEKIKKKE
jgi:hypothetical protein